MMVSRARSVPVKDRTKSDYHVRVERVVDLIRQDPSLPFTVRELADAAAFSEFHFHRVFKSIAGETVAKCIQRLRLEAAAQRLVHERSTTITEIALNSGFSSSANFARAFHKLCGCSPTQCRRNRAVAFKNSSVGKARAEDRAYPEAMSTDVEILKVPEQDLASLRMVGPYVASRIGQLFADLCAWHEAELGRSAPHEAIGITWSDSALAEEETWRYDACIAVPKGTKGSGRVVIRALAEGWIARLAVTLPAAEMHRLSDCWDWLMFAWLPTTDADLADRPAYETYSPLGQGDAFDITLCLPLKRQRIERDHARQP